MIYRPTIMGEINTDQGLQFIWRVDLGRIPMTDALKKQGVNIDSLMYSACIGGDEEVNHLLISCPYAHAIQEAILSLYGIQKCGLQSVSDLIHYATTWGRCPRLRSRFIAIGYILLWSLWKVRNKRRYRNAFASTSRVVENIKSLTYLWIKYKGKKTLEEWSSPPLSV
ncbi:hypothetical protein LXL04_014817 [Taraxacum kok-saghyz]